MLYRPDPDESAAVPPPPDEALLARYFARIGYSGPARPTLAVLEALQAAHIAAIPFESIDALVEGHIDIGAEAVAAKLIDARRSEEHTSELQSLMRISYAVFCLKKKKHKKRTNTLKVSMSKRSND